MAAHDRWLRTIAYARLPEREAVDEVMQEVALAVMRQAARQAAPLAHPAKAGPWLYRLTVRQVLLYRRGCGRRRKLTDRFAARHPPTAEDSAAGDPLAWLLADERNFIELSSSPLWMADEVVVREGPTEGERLTSALRRAPGLTRQEFLEHWQHVHAPLALEHNDVLGFTHYVQLHTPASADDFPLARDRGAPPAFDGVAEIYREDTRPSPDHRVEVADLIRQDEDRFIDHGTSPVWLGRVERIV